MNGHSERQQRTAATTAYSGVSEPSAPQGLLAQAANARQIAQRMRVTSVEGPDGGACPVREVLSRIGDTWTVLVILQLGLGSLRFAELQRSVKGISPRMLTATLRTLERDGLLIREVQVTRPVSVIYGLSPLGESLLPPLEQLANWATQSHANVRAARQEFDVVELETGQREARIHRLTPRRSGVSGAKV